jgi:hypothetical protein
VTGVLGQRKEDIEWKKGAEASIGTVQQAGNLLENQVREMSASTRQDFAD